VSSFGTNDLIEVFNGGTGVVSVYKTAHVLVDGGEVTVSALQGSNTQAFFNVDGGILDFINTSTGAATLNGAVAGAIGGSATVFGGVGGGYYAGGPGGNNSLVGGSGLVTLYGAGANSYLSASSTSSGSYSELFAGTGSTTMVGTTGSVNNEFHGGSGSASILSSGAGTQNYFVGSTGQENISGSTVPGATNNYYFLQNSSGSGSDIITDFNLSTDKIMLNPFGPYSGVNVASISANGGAGGGSIICLSDNTTITLYGVRPEQLTALGVEAGSMTI
jgi:hypothetical protein